MCNQSVFHRIEVHVIKVPLEILRIPDYVVVVAPLPHASRAFAQVRQARQCALFEAANQPRNGNVIMRADQ